MTIAVTQRPTDLHAVPHLVPHSDAYVAPHSDMYASDMVRRVLRGIQEMRLQLGDVFKGVEERDEHAVFTRRGKPVAVLVDIEWYRKAAKAVKDPTEF